MKQERTWMFNLKTRQNKETERINLSKIRNMNGEKIQSICLNVSDLNDTQIEYLEKHLKSTLIKVRATKIK